MKLTVSNISGKELSLVKTTLSSGDSITVYVPDEVYLGQEILTDAVEKLIWDDLQAFETAGYISITAVPQEGSGELALANGKIFIGDGSGIAIENAVSGDVTISNVGVTTIGAKKVVNTMIAAAAGTALVGTKTAGNVTALDCSASGALAIGQGAGETMVAHALSGDVTMDNDGVTAIGADKVLKTMVKDYELDYSNVAIANGKVLVGDGSGHAVEQALGADATLVSTKVTLSNAQLKALHTTAIEVIPAPGANKIVEVATLLIKHIYATAAFTVAGDSDFVCRYVDATGVICTQEIEGTGVFDQVADTYTNGRNKINVIASAAQIVNTAVVIHNTGTELADGGGTADVWVHYRVYDVA